MNHMAAPGRGAKSRENTRAAPEKREKSRKSWKSRGKTPRTIVIAGMNRRRKMDRVISPGRARHNAAKIGKVSGSGETPTQSAASSWKFPGKPPDVYLFGCQLTFRGWALIHGVRDRCCCRYRICCRRKDGVESRADGWKKTCFYFYD